MVPSSLYEAFLAGEERDASNLVITFDTSLRAWLGGSAAHARRGGCVVGGYRIAVDLLGAASINPSALPDCVAAQV